MSSRTLRSSARNASLLQTSSEIESRKRKRRDTRSDNIEQSTISISDATLPESVIHKDHDEIKGAPKKSIKATLQRKSKVTAKNQQQPHGRSTEDFVRKDHTEIVDPPANPKPGTKGSRMWRTAMPASNKGMEATKERNAARNTKISSEASQPTKSRSITLMTQTNEASKQDDPSREDQPFKPQPTLEVESNHLTVSEEIGDLFAAPAKSVIIHACNTQGTWGAGIALAFKKYYPSAFLSYKDHCAKHGEDLLGKALLIPPQTGSTQIAERSRLHYVGCLFTSAKKGKSKGTPEQILDATTTAMDDLLRQLGDEEEGNAREIRMRKINSGLFGVPWADTRKVLESIELNDGEIRKVLVVSREQDK